MENRHVRTLVHTALEPAEGFAAADAPASHRPVQRYLAYKQGFNAVDENKHAVKDGSLTPRRGISTFATEYDLATCPPRSFSCSEKSSANLYT
jgi:hypothetical protein